MSREVKLLRFGRALWATIALGLPCAAYAVYSFTTETSAQVAPPKQGSRTGFFRPTPSHWASLSVEPVRLMRFRSGFSTEGKITIDEDRATRVYSQYAGRVVKLGVGTGDRVQKGDALFVIEATDSIEAQKDFVSALGDLNKTKSQVNLTTIAERRLSNLYKDKAMSLKEWEESQANLTAAKNDMRTAEIGLQAIRNRLRLLGKTDAEVQAFENTGVISPDAPVYSPIAGTVLQRRIGPGQFLDAGASSAEPAMLIGETSKVWLVVYVREGDADGVRMNQPVSFTVLTLPGQVFEARVSYIASSLEPTSRRLLVRATVDNPDGRLKPEMFANARITIGETQASPAVPRDAVIYEGDQARLWVTHDDGAIELRRVKIGLTDGGFAQVVSGLGANEKVIARGSLFIDRAATLGS
jgi:membrane fusion protein, heavy metal efflux system